MIQAINGYGVWRGLGKGLWRLLRCQPFAKGGYDPVTPKREFRIQNSECRMQNHSECGSAISASSALRKWGVSK
jgi:putative component of membrane protein insertase Oxa1/YidC/SpoIIIJ protein YidD